MEIPQSKYLSTSCLNCVFNNTVATFKYYWFLGILDLVVIQRRTLINVWDILISMVANAWFPVNYFRLSFGKSDSLYNTILILQKEKNIPINISANQLMNILKNKVDEPEFKRLLSFLKENVPYWFLSPWFPQKTKAEIVTHSQTFENRCLYKIEKNNSMMHIELNPIWLSYLQENYTILRDFTYWNLTLFLQVRNPNVPNIPNKLIKSEVRNSLNKQRNFWNSVIQANYQVNCIYTGRKLEINHYDLDHFIPWSFVSHNLLWNLMPADSSINCSKNNKLPNLQVYLPKLARAHQSALQIYLKLGKNSELLEDYLSFGHTAQELAGMDFEHLYSCYEQTFIPMNQIALNMGFESWKNTK